jgi:hypothetical protein
MSLKSWRSIAIALALSLFVVIGLKFSAIDTSGLEADWEAVGATGTIIGALLGAVTAGGAVAIAWKSYEASQKSIRVAETALNADRALLISGEVSATYKEMKDPLFEYMRHQVEVKIPLQNHGLSPALRVSADTTLDFGGWVSDEVLEIGNDSVRRNFPAIVPGAVQSLTVNIFGKRALALKQGDKMATIKLEVLYDDMFVGTDMPKRRHFRTINAMHWGGEVPGFGFVFVDVGETMIA